MTIATLSSAVLAPINGASVRRLFTGWGRSGMRTRARVQAQAQAIQAAGLFGAVPLQATPSTRKWPFPPVQPAAPTPRDDAAAQDAATQVQAQASAKRDAKRDAKRAASDADLGDVRHLSTVQALGVRRMVIDVLLVAVWGALIPGVLWLGAASGF
ncbi:Uncharacterised protein [Bordetella ansorpii]|uniref:Uncharacterized protein n=1 Tax=Bordetella ansorpii TaxID=288768 RepID=A0A157SCK1_9BORD|nr:hypothetical protein [Bordetella ansorpii]SAI68084.1 Uncharacterised protein [Bordetella ansorpii]